MRNFSLQKPGLLIVFSLLILAAAITLACGSSLQPLSQHLLESVSVSPATADANDYPDGQVPFTATGYFNKAPSPVTPLKATWGSCYQNAPTNEVTVSSAGVAQCVTGAAGTYSVFASDPGPVATCNVINACGGGCQVSGYAQLTCP